jgi:rhamnose transport system permease protein
MNHPSRGTAVPPVKAHPRLPSGQPPPSRGTGVSPVQANPRPSTGLPPVNVPPSHTSAALWRRHESALVGLLVLTFVVMSLLSRDFLTAGNLLSMPRYFVEPGLIALAMALVIITGGIDLSVGSTMALAAVVLGICWGRLNLPIGVAVLAALLTGALAGLLNGLIITRLGVPPLMVTLATMASYRGIAVGLSHAQPVSDFPPAFLALGNSYLRVGPGVEIPSQLFLFIVLAIVAGVVLWRTVLGRQVYAIGHNEIAARYAGINVDLVKLGVYMGAGLISALAAVIAVARVATAKADAGTGMELLVITGCVLGGIDIYGGRGTILGAVLGVLIINTVGNGLQLADVGSEMRMVVTGILLIVAVILGQLGRRGRAADTGE